MPNNYYFSASDDEETSIQSRKIVDLWTSFVKYPKKEKAKLCSSTVARAKETELRTFPQIKMTERQPHIL